MSLASELARGVRLFDGALGTQLLVSGFHPQRDLLGAGPTALSLTRPEQVRAVHESYLDAGAHWLRTNTFLATPADLARHGLAGRAQELARSAARAALEAASAFETEVPQARVLGAIGPGEAPNGTSPAERADDVRQLASWLLAAGVHGLMLETQTRLDHVDAVHRAIRPLADARERGVVVSFVVSPDGRLADGATLEDVAAWATAAHPLLLALNCGRGPADSEAHVATLRRLYRGALGALPTAGVPTDPRDHTGYPVAPHEFGEVLASWVRRHQLSAVGGCCGTGPRHVAALSDALGFVRSWAPPEDDFGADLDEDGDVAGDIEALEDERT
jgi:5-methyltetrahydrofolate--homocysteine methyltransferase